MILTIIKNNTNIPEYYDELICNIYRETIWLKKIPDNNFSELKEEINKTNDDYLIVFYGCLTFLDMKFFYSNEKLEIKTYRHIEVNSLKEYYKHNDNWCKGKRYKLNEESRLSMLEKQGDKSGKNNNFYGKKHSDESKKKISESNRKHRIYTYDELYNLYFIENLSQKEISELLGLTRVVRIDQTICM